MDRASALPDRCVVCNAPAEGYRLSRKLYWSPLAWRAGALIAPFAAMALGLYLDVAILAMSFWPLVILLLITHTFVRKSLKLELGVCPRHRRLRNTFIALSTACIAGVFAGILSFQTGIVGIMILLGSVVGLLVLAVMQSYFGAQAIRLKELSPEHAWLARTGAAFRSELPELQ